MIRSTEAVIASVLMLGSLIYMFNVPDTESEDPVEQYIRSLLDSYSDVARFLGTRDPYTLELLIKSSMPRGYNQKVTMNFFRKYITYTGIGSAPVEKYVLMPSESSTNLQYSETKSNWRRAIFQISNSGGSTLSGQTSISASLFKPDLNGDGISDPIDVNSIMLFSDDGELNSTVTSYDDYFNRTVVGVTTYVDVEPGEKENIYVYYMVGDDFE